MRVGATFAAAAHAETSSNGGGGILAHVVERAWEWAVRDNVFLAETSSRSSRSDRDRRGYWLAQTGGFAQPGRCSGRAALQGSGERSALTVPDRFFI